MQQRKEWKDNENKKRGILFFSLLEENMRVVVCLFLWTIMIQFDTNQEDIKWDIESIKNDSYDGIQGDYLSLSFFSDTAILASEVWEVQFYQQNVNRQNLIFAVFLPNSKRNWKVLQNQILTMPIGMIAAEAPVTNESNEVLWIALGIGTLTIGMFYVQKKLRSRRE